MNIIDTAWGLILIICVLKYGMPLADAFFKNTMRNLNEENNR